MMKAGLGADKAFLKEEQVDLSGHYCSLICLFVLDLQTLGYMLESSSNP